MKDIQILNFIAIFFSFWVGTLVWDFSRKYSSKKRFVLTTASAILSFVLMVVLIKGFSLRLVVVLAPYFFLFSIVLMLLVGGLITLITAKYHLRIIANIQLLLMGVCILSAYFGSAFLEERKTFCSDDMINGGKLLLVAKCQYEDHTLIEFYKEVKYERFCVVTKGSDEYISRTQLRKPFFGGALHSYSPSNSNNFITSFFIGNEIKHYMTNSKNEKISQYNCVGK